MTQRLQCGVLTQHAMQVDTEAQRSASVRGETGTYTWILFAFILSRLTLLTFNDAEFTDGYLYIQWTFDQLELRHPLYPFFIQVFVHLLDPVIAGRLVSSLAGLISLAILYLISFKFYGKTAAMITGALFTLSPLILWLHSRVLSESLFLMFFLAALYYFLESFDDRRWANLFLQIFYSGLATLTRPEGLSFLPLLIYSLYFSTRQGEKKSLIYSLPAWIPWIFFGLWTLLSGSGYSQIMESNVEKSTVADFVTYLVLYMESYPYVMCYPVFALAILGIFRSYPGPRNRWLLVLAYFHVVWFLTISIHRWWSTRFLLVPLTLLLVEAAASLDFLRTRLSNRNWSILTACTLLACAVLGVTSLYFQKQVFADVKESALFVRDHFNSHRLFSDEKTKVSYYTGNYVHVFQPNTSFSEGDILILNSFYTPLRTAVESLNKRYNLALLYQAKAQTIPILANINTETTIETHTPNKFVWRFEKQRFHSLVIGIASRK